MPDMLQRGADWLADKLAAHASHAITYVRGAERIPLSATFGRTEYQVEDDFGLRVAFTDRDFIVRADTLVLGGKRSKPKEGDRIEEPVGNELHVFEVMVPEGSEQCFRYCDPNRVMMRIHAKFVSVL